MKAFFAAVIGTTISGVLGGAIAIGILFLGEKIFSEKG